MKFIPEIDLSEECQIPYTPEVHDWVEENLPGMRRISVGLFVKRNNYNSICTIEFFSKDQKNSNNEKPKSNGREIKADELCEILMKIVQFDIEAKDQIGQYRFLITRTTDKGQKQFSKHFEPPSQDGDGEGRFVPNPSQYENTDVIPTLMNYIQRLQDQDISKSKLITDIVQPLQAQNLELQKRVIELSNVHLGVAQLQYQKEMWERDKELETQLQLEKAKLDKQKKDKMWDTLRGTGAIETFASVAGTIAQNKFGIQIPVQQEMQKKQEKIKNVEEEIEKTKQEQEKLREEVKNNPLKAHCNGLWGSLDDEQRERLKNDLGEDFNDFQSLLTSSSEKEARIKLKHTMEKFKDDPMKLMGALNILEESQQKIASWILNYGMQDNE